MPTWALIAIAALYATYALLLACVLRWLYRDYHPAAARTDRRNRQ